MYLWQEATGFSRALETHSKLDAMVSQLSQSQPSSEPLLSTGEKTNQSMVRSFWLHGNKMTRNELLYAK